MNSWLKNIGLVLAIIVTPFVVLKLIGRDISFEKELSVKIFPQKDGCLPIRMQSLVNEERIALEPVLQFAFVKSGVMRQIGNSELRFANKKDGRYKIPSRQSVNACLNFISPDKRDEILRSIKNLPLPRRLECKLLVGVDKPGREVRHHYGNVFDCDQYLKISEYGVF